MNLYYTSLVHFIHLLLQASASLLIFFVLYYAPHEPTKVLLQLSYYPLLLPDNQLSSAIRYREHTDYTCFTILHKDESNVGDLDDGGLQVRLPNGNWYAVPSSPGAFVVNIGDLYKVWTNGRFQDCCRKSNNPCNILLQAQIFSFRRNNQHKAETEINFDGEACITADGEECGL